MGMWENCSALPCWILLYGCRLLWHWWLLIMLSNEMCLNIKFCVLLLFNKLKYASTISINLLATHSVQQTGFLTLFITLTEIRYNMFTCLSSACKNYLLKNLNIVISGRKIAPALKIVLNVYATCANHLYLNSIGFLLFITCLVVLEQSRWINIFWIGILFRDCLRWWFLKQNIEL